MAMSRSAKKPLMSALILCLVLVGFTSTSHAQYEAPILFKQTISQIVVTDQVDGWPPGHETSIWRSFNGVVASADASKVFFSVCVRYSYPDVCRAFVANSDGTGLQDVSAIFPSNLVSSTWGWGNMVINDDGSEVFIRAQTDDGKVYIQYLDTSTLTTGQAVSQWWWSGYFDWYTANSSASRLYTGKHDWGYNDSLGRNLRGLGYTNRNGLATQYMDIYDLPCFGLCNNLNGLYFMGSSVQGDHSFFSWTSNYEGNASINNRSAMWHTTLAGPAHKLTTEDHLWVDQGDWRGVCTEDGSTAVYQYLHRSGDPKEIHVVDVATGTERFISSTTDLNPVHTFITRDGHYLFAQGSKGEYGYHYNTLYDLEGGGARDSWSYHIPWPNDYSNITDDNRYYFVSRNEALYRVDMGGGEFGKAPNVNSISFSEPYLWHDASAQIGIEVDISDAQGVSNVEWVRLDVLVEGFEEPDFYMPRLPLAFPATDGDWTLLHDDGTHGDVTAGDGTFTHDAIATRKGSYDDWNTWFTNFSLPHDVGIRIVVKDLDGNYTTADTNLWISAINEDPTHIFSDGFESGDTSAW